MVDKNQALTQAAMNALQQQRNNAMDAVANLNAQLFVAQQELVEMTVQRDALKAEREAATKVPDPPQALD